MKVEKQDWDSEFFGLRIGRVEICSKEEGLFLASQGPRIRKDYDLLYVFANHGLTFSASDARLVDEKVVYSISPSSNTIIDGNIISWSEKQGVSFDLLHLALVSGEYSRFRLDDKLPKGSYERLYSRWIEQSVNRAIASEVFCYMIDDVPKGLVTIKHKNGKGSIGLVAVHEDYQHQGIGSAMMCKVLLYSKEIQLHRLSVVTQLANRPGCKLYEKSGFIVESITDVWHWWL